MRKLIGAALALAFSTPVALAQQLPVGISYPGLYSSSLPTLAAGKNAPMAIDANGRLILAPSTSIMISNFPAVQPVSQSGAFTVTQGPAGAAPWPVTWTGQSVNADLRVGGAAVAAGNPVPVTGTVVLGAGAAQIGTIGNSFLLDATFTARIPPLGQKASAGSVPVVLPSDGTLPLPTGAATAANQSTANTSLASIDGKTPPLAGGRVPVDGSGVTQPVSAAALPLPAGAATAAKQPALGTAGAPSADVLTVQGNASGTPLPISSPTLATAANQTSEIAQLTALNQRNVYFTDVQGGVNANVTFTGPTRNVGASPSAYAKFNQLVNSTQSGTAIIEGSTDGTTFYLVQSQAVAANGSSVLSVPAAYPYMRSKFTMGATSGFTFIQSSLSAN